MVGSATLTKLLGTSAWYAPGAAGAFVVESIIHKPRVDGFLVQFIWKVNTVESDICCGVPVILGRTVLKRSLNCL